MGAAGGGIVRCEGTGGRQHLSAATAAGLAGCFASRVLVHSCWCQHCAPANLRAPKPKPYLTTRKRLCGRLLKVTEYKSRASALSGGRGWPSGLVICRAQVCDWL